MAPEKGRTLMRVRDFHSRDIFSRESLGDALRPVTAAEFDAAIEATHLRNGIQLAAEETERLADKASGETRMRILMALRCLLDAQDYQEGKA